MFSLRTASLFDRLRLIKPPVLFFIALSLIMSSCYRAPRTLEPQVSYSVQDTYLKGLPGAFPPLSTEEVQTSWGSEYKIGLQFAKDLDLYRAISTFKRAEILIPDSDFDRKQELQYFIIYCYYLGKRYDEVVESFRHSSLRDVNEHFPAYHDLLVILYESYHENEEEEQAEYILQLLRENYPDTAKRIELSSALIDGNIDALYVYSYRHPKDQDVKNLLHDFRKEKKSISTAEALNAVIPGAGYLYVGQKQSAITALLVNSLFIAAAAHFFNKGEHAAGIITTSFEVGWYFGGIYGAGEAAKLYNERLYEEKAYHSLKQKGLFPVLMLRYSF